jgi:hypothetical protein
VILTICWVLTGILALAVLVATMAALIVAGRTDREAARSFIRWIADGAGPGTGLASGTGDVPSDSATQLAARHRDAIRDREAEVSAASTICDDDYAATEYWRPW